ncbi:hypothetical protein ACOSQ3_031580 [Xanthoceras sorbifolium]
MEEDDIGAGQGEDGLRVFSSSQFQSQLFDNLLKGRKVLNMTKMKGPLVLHNLVPSILHDIPTPTAAPSRVTLHNARIMFSAPSPGMGN